MSEGSRGFYGQENSRRHSSSISGTSSSFHGDRGARLSIAHLLDTETYAGRESVVERLAAGQREADWDVRVVAVVTEEAKSPPFLEAAEDADLPLDVLRVASRAYLEERRRLIALFREHETDVLHSHGYRPDVVGGSAAKEAGLARVSTVHGFVGGGWKNRLYEWIQRRSLRGFDRVVGVSDEVADTLVRAGVPSSRVRVVRNAWGGRTDFLSGREARERLGVCNERFLIGWVGRLSREKGPDVLLNALRRSKMSGVTISFVGEGPERESLSRRGRELSSALEVRCHGQVSDAYRLFPAFDVFVLSSRTEGTPMVLLEAMAAEVPVVATAVGGIPDVVTEQEAWLVPPEDPEALRRAIAEVRADPDVARDRAAAARNRLQEEFGVDQWVERYGSVYRDAVRTGAGSGGR